MNQAQTRINWMFTKRDARAKFGYKKKSSNRSKHYSISKGTTESYADRPEISWRSEPSSLSSTFKIGGVGIFPNGEFVVCNLDGKESLPYDELSWRRESILVLDGATGRLRHQIDRKREDYGGKNVIAITNDGSLIAIESGSDIRWNGKRADETSVHIMEAKTGRVLPPILPCETAVKDRRAAGISSLQFTPDGQYLISSGESTRIWKRVART